MHKKRSRQPRYKDPTKDILKTQVDLAKFSVGAQLTNNITSQIFKGLKLP
jgi:hypothetical protein